VSAALAYLFKLIDAGIEFPDAQFKTCVKFGVNSDELADAYDAQFSLKWLQE